MSSQYTQLKTKQYRTRRECVHGNKGERENTKNCFLFFSFLNTPLAYGTTSRGKRKKERTENKIFLSFRSLLLLYRDETKFILIDITFSYSPYARNSDGTDSIDGIASSV